MGRPTNEQLAAKAAAADAAREAAAKAQEGAANDAAPNEPGAGEADAKGSAERPIAESVRVVVERNLWFSGEGGKVALRLREGENILTGAALEFARSACPELLPNG